MIDQSLLLLFPAVMAFAAAMDMLTMTIPNRVSILLVAAFFVAAYAAGLSQQQVLEHLATGAAVLAICFVLFALGVFGGGDAKLLAASSLWIGFDQLLPYFLGVSIAGALLSVAFLYMRNHFPEGSVRGPAWVLRLQAQGNGMPYGLAISASALWIYPQTAFFHGLAF
ncbi:MAG: prepilin peptidase [Hyphomicrobiaceae bacterium]|nr:prepilin peptidase [Hyphomicrobiaceae bacterium]MCC0008849.1 prepilin peptidase [Hyphomicrobiaceae bacterium]